MATSVTDAARRRLVDRWRAIECEDEREIPSSASGARIQKKKEDWFSDSFKYITSLSKEKHVWCEYWDLMTPLLETFNNYSCDKRHNSPLKVLWKRICQELRTCTRCVFQHHQAQNLYLSEYESDAVGPLLRELQRLDEERVTDHLKELNSVLTCEKYSADDNNAEVVCVLFEVLMHPKLLDGESLVNEFQVFIEAVDKAHELELAGHQQYPGVYALLFLKSVRARSIGYRLAGTLGKLRSAEDLEPLQPMLKKCIDYLETEVLPSNMEASRPRIQLGRLSAWIGIKSLLNFVEPSAFEEGIIERHPIFVSIVLNHVCDDTSEFTYAVNCLRLMFEMLGYKLWLKTTISPSVMHNTLLGQCFRTKNEKSHKEIFDAFLPFLQSLEPLEDGEHEKQRRHFIYFLLHQVSHSSNFSMLTKKLARKMALLVIRRGYVLNCPCPPHECAHVWGPSLVSSLKDSSLHNSLRVPAFDLISTVIVSDSAALMHIKLKNNATFFANFGLSAEYNDVNNLAIDVENDSSCWGEFSEQSLHISRECTGWVCVPLLWIDILIAVDLSTLPSSLSKAFFWSLSRVTLLEPMASAEIGLSLNDWLSSHKKELPCSLVWQVPNGCDDGDHGIWSENSLKASTAFSSLTKLLKRCVAHFVTEAGRFGFWKQWSWEPLMAESLILLLIDADDGVRQVAKQILEHVSNSRGLTPGLQFLCSDVLSLKATFFGLQYAVILVYLVNSHASNLSGLQHLFFITRKLFKEVVAAEKSSVCLADKTKASRFSSDGGFLVQPCFDKSCNSPSLKASNVVDEELWSRYCLLLSRRIWPTMVKCLKEGKIWLEHKASQMTFVRLFELFPVVFEKLVSPASQLSRIHKVGVLDTFGYIWFLDLIELGKASNAIVRRHWKECVTSLLCLLRDSCSSESKHLVDSIEILIFPETHALDDLKVKVAELFATVFKYDAQNFEVKPLEWPCRVVKKPVADENILRSGTVNSANAVSSEDPDVIILDAWDSSIRASKSVEVVVLDEEPDKFMIDGVKLNCSLNQQVFSKNTKAVNIHSTVKSGPSQKVDSVSSPKDIISSKVGADKSHAWPTTLMSNLEALAPTSSAHIEEMKGSLDIIIDKESSFQKGKAKLTSHVPALPKSAISIPKRHVIQLAMPTSKSSIFGQSVRSLKPPRLDGWYKPILEIDYFYTVGLSPEPVDNHVTPTDFQKVPICFSSLEHYVQIFRPFVLEELRAQLLNNFLEVSSPEEMSCGSLSIMSVERVDDFHLVRCKADEKEASISRGCVENDLVLLTKEPLQHSAQSLHVLGKVERREKDGKNKAVILVIRFYLLTGSSRINTVKKLLVERSKWFVNRIMSITPQLREFQALSSLKDIPLLPVILNPIDCEQNRSKCTNLDLSSLSLSLQQILKDSFNNSQLQAVSAVIGRHAAKGSFDLSLIQGPPGTGKTRTILAIVSALLSLRSVRKDSLNEGRTVTDLSTARGKVSQSVAVARAWQDAALAKQLSKDEASFKLKKSTESKKRVLICAQSNAAVDELVSRIATCGLYGSDGKMYKPYLVRVGNVKTVHPNSLPFFIDTLVDQRLADEKLKDNAGKNESEDSLTTLRSKLEKLVEKIRFFEAKRANLRDKDFVCGNSTGDKILDEQDEMEMSDGAIEAKLDTLYSNKRAVCAQLASVQAREKKSFEELRALKHKFRRTILCEADIVVTTLSGSGGDVYGACQESVSNAKFGSEDSLFDAVVIDEAAQALEPATLIPLQLLKSTGTKCIMVGDPKQLPATVLSSTASKFLYECSMFERLQRAGHPVIMLTQQYRMHPEICLFPSLHFYEGKLLNGDAITTKEALFHKDAHFGPYVFYDIMDGYERRGKNSNSPSLYNEAEADAAIELVRAFSRKYPSEFVGGKIGVITPYRSQLSLLQSRFSHSFASSSLDIEFNTVDGFQGREVDILILSTVRGLDANRKAPDAHLGNVGFVADVRRMNVSLTRAKFSLWILGNASTLESNSNWKALLLNARARNLVLSVKRPYRSIFTELTNKASSLSKVSADNVGKPRNKGDLPPVTANQDRRSQNNHKEQNQRAYSKVENASEKVSRRSVLDGQVSSDCPDSSRSASSSGRDAEVIIVEEVGQLSASLATGKKTTDELSKASDRAKIREEAGPSRCNKQSDGRSGASLGTSNEANSREELSLCRGINTRKQRWDAVDALLSSALIPSKRPKYVSMRMEPKGSVASKPAESVQSELNEDGATASKRRMRTSEDTGQSDGPHDKRKTPSHEDRTSRSLNTQKKFLDGSKK